MLRYNHMRTHLRVQLTSVKGDGTVARQEIHLVSAFIELITGYAILVPEGYCEYAYVSVSGCRPKVRRGRWGP